MSTPLLMLLLLAWPVVAAAAGVGLGVLIDRAERIAAQRANGQPQQVATH